MLQINQKPEIRDRSENRLNITAKQWQMSHDTLIQERWMTLTLNDLLDPSRLFHPDATYGVMQS